MEDLKVKELSTPVIQETAEAFFAVDKEWNITYLNQGAERYCGKRDQLMRKSIWSIFGGQFTSEIVNSIRNVKENEYTTVQLVSPYLNKTFRMKVSSVPSGYLAILSDVPAPLPQTENFSDKSLPAVKYEAIRGSFPEIRPAAELNEQLLRRILDASINGIVYFRAIRNQIDSIINFELVMANEQAVKLLGKKDPVLSAPGKSFLLLANDIFDSMLFERMVSVLKTKENTDYDSYFLQGEHRIWFHKSLVRLEDGVVVTLENITPGKQETELFKTRVQHMKDVREIEEELRAKNKLINRIFNNLPVAIFRLDKNGFVQEAMGLGLRKIGLENIEAAGASIYEVYPMMESEVSAVFRGKTVNFTAAIDFDGKRSYFQNYFFYDTEKGSAIGLAIDITEQKEAEGKLRLEKEFTFSLLDNSIDGIFAFDRDMKITAWNRTIELHYKVQRKHAIGQKLNRVFPDFKDTEEAEAIRKSFRGKKTTLLNRVYERCEGFFELTVIPLFNNSKQFAGGLCIIHDVTETVRLEQEATALRIRQQKEILKAILEAQELERKRISEGLHNGVGQLLYAARLNLEHLSPSDTLARDVFSVKKDLGSLLDEAIKETRTISFELMPTILKDFGLETALKEIMKKFLGVGFHIQFEISGFAIRPAASFETAVFRIVQELINNIVKHAYATRASVIIIRNDAGVWITVMDNGKGFGEQELSQLREGLGLRTIKNRVELLNGSMHVESRLGKGTLITIEISEK